MTDRPILRVESHAPMTDRRIVRIDPSLLHVPRAVMAELHTRGVDPSSLHVDELVTRLADRQDGIVVREQLAVLGLGRGAIAHRRKRGLLVALHKGVFLWARHGASTRTRARAAAMAAGEGALVSHGWALALWGLRDARGELVDVMTAGRRVRCDGVRGHETGAIDPSDVRDIGGIPLTSPARTLLDSARRLTARELADAAEAAQINRLVTKRAIVAAIDRAPRHAGAGPLRALLAETAFTRSRAERKLVALLRAAQLPEPVFNASVEGFEVDALWAQQRVVLEFDSYAFHATRAAFERDRRKTAALTRTRHLVLRTTWRELTEQSHALVARTAEALAPAGG
jgi:very-short-patch-repair endonuclease